MIDRLTTRAFAPRRSTQTARRATTPTRALFGKKPAAESTQATASRFKGAKKSTGAAAPAPGEPYYVDGKLWVCQGCGYVYDGSKGAWAEGKRCPMCGERRFALKTPQELQLAIYSLVAVVVLVASLFLIVKI